MAEPDYSWWHPFMKTELGNKIKDLFAHPCDGMPYAGSFGFDDRRGCWVRVEDLIKAIRDIEADICAREERGLSPEEWEWYRKYPEFYDLIFKNPGAEGADAEAGTE